MSGRSLARALVLLAGAAALLLAACGSGGGSSGKPKITIGSTNFAEQSILADLYAQVLQANGYNVDRRLNLGSREIVEPALESGQIDMYVDYMATLLAFLDRGASPRSTDAAATYTRLQQVLTPRKLTALAYAPAVDTNGYVVTKATADRYRLSTMSDLAPVAGQMVLGGPPECPDRPYCLPGLKDVYGIVFKEFKPLDTGGPLTVAALEADQVQVGVLFTTDAVIAARNLVLLTDDKHLQSADNVVPLIRDAWLSGAPADFKPLLDSVSAKITTAALTDLNKQVGLDRKESKDVASTWLKSQGLVQ